MKNPSIQFRSEAAPGASFTALGLSGEEAVSRPYRFTVDLASSDPALPLDTIAGAPAVLTLGGREVCGVVTEIEQGEALGHGAYAYRAVLAPRLALLGLVKHTQIYQRLSVPELVEVVIAQSGLVLEVERRLARSYPPRDHAVQYQESALDFVSRLLEQAGVAYFFEHTDGRERLVLSDHDGGFRAGVTASVGEGEGARVRALRCRRKVAPRSLVLLDYNERTPGVPLQAEADVDERGFGLHVDIADPFTTPEQGAELAAMRAEELRCRATTYEGSCDAPLAAGARLDLLGHFRGDWNRDYVVTRVHHRVDDRLGATCDFEALPAQMGYRPERLTPRPRLGGTMVAHVDARGPEGTAAADAEGRYRVVMPFDLSGAAEAQASMPMRMATPYGGTDEGMHFTLRKGAEVLWTGVDGDPERPVITGVVPNARSRVVSGGEAALNGIRMPNGAIFEMGSGFGKKRGAGTTSATREASEAKGSALPLEQQLGTEPDNPYESYEQGGTCAEDWMRIAVPHSNGKYSYVRYGEKATAAVGTFTEATGINAKWDWSTLDSGYDMTSDDRDKGSAAHFGWDQSEGVYDYTDGNRTTITGGDQQSVTTGNRTDVVLGNYRLVIPNRTLGVYDADFYSMTFSKDWQGWRKTTRAHVSTVNLTYGDNSNFFTGINFGMGLGGNYSINAGINGNIFLGLSTGITAGMTCNIAYGPVFEFGNTKKLSTAGDQDIKARTKVHLRVRAAEPGALHAAKPWAIALAAGAAGAVFGAGGAAAGKDDLDKGAGLTGMTWGIATLAALGGAALIHKLALANAGGVNNSELILEATEATLRCGAVPGPTLHIQNLPVPEIALKVSAAGPSITIGATSIVLSCGAAGPSITLDAVAGVEIRGSATTFMEVTAADIGAEAAGRAFLLNAAGFNHA